MVSDSTSGVSALLVAQLQGLICLNTITGFGELNDPSATIEDFLGDFERVEFMDKYLDSLGIAIRY